MTDTAVQPSTARYLTDGALLADLGALHSQLEYLDAVETTENGYVIDRGRAPERLVNTWEALVAEAEFRGLIS